MQGMGMVELILDWWQLEQLGKLVLHQYLYSAVLYSLPCIIYETHFFWDVLVCFISDAHV